MGVIGLRKKINYLLFLHPFGFFDLVEDSDDFYLFDQASQAALQIN